MHDVQGSKVQLTKKTKEQQYRINNVLAATREKEHPICLMQEDFLIEDLKILFGP